MARCERLGIPYAPIAKPSDLFDDPHLLASGGLLPVEMSTAEGGSAPAMPIASLPAAPVSFSTGRPGLRRQPPKLGEHSFEIAREAGLSEAEIERLIKSGALVAAP